MRVLSSEALRISVIGMFLAAVTTPVHGAPSPQDDTKNATPIVSGKRARCSCSNGEQLGQCWVANAPIVCPAGCSPTAGDGTSDDACQPLASECSKSPKISQCSERIENGLYRLRLPGVKLDNGQVVCLNSRTQDPHRRLQQLDCRDVDESFFLLDERDAQGCYRMKSPLASSNTVIGILTDGDKTFVAELGTKANCQAGADQYHWNLVPVQTPSGKRFQIQNKLTGLCIDADDNTRRGGGKVQPLDCRNVPNQLFELERIR